ncbi:hypothetical protein [Xanthomonas sp. 10-10]|uniref:Uncharacterized protein n=1 Tax=Xanthomonas sp. 10-10 TaxID=3115848 RepID=A0AAU7P7R2_9XANT
MATTVRAMVTQAVAERIYANYLRGNPPFKPWKGMQGCAWFAYDGSPNAGSLASKDIEVSVDIDVPQGAPVISKQQLEEHHHELMTTKNINYSSAEGRMWGEFVGKCGRESSCGVLIVDVGGSKFSQSQGKYLLVNNKGLGLLRMTPTQAETLQRDINAKAGDAGHLDALKERINGKKSLHGATFTIFVSKGMELKNFKSNCMDRHMGNPKRTQDSEGWTDTKGREYVTLEYDDYHEAKRRARRIYGEFEKIRNSYASVVICWCDENGKVNGEQSSRLDLWAYRSGHKIVGTTQADSPPSYGGYQY